MISLGLGMVNLFFRQTASWFIFMCQICYEISKIYSIGFTELMHSQKKPSTAADLNGLRNEMAGIANDVLVYVKRLLSFVKQ